MATLADVTHVGSIAHAIEAASTRKPVLYSRRAFWRGFIVGTLCTSVLAVSLVYLLFA